MHGIFNLKCEINVISALVSVKGLERVVSFYVYLLNLIILGFFSWRGLVLSRVV